MLFAEKNITIKGGVQAPDIQAEITEIRRKEKREKESRGSRKYMIRKLWEALWSKFVNRETVSYFIFGVLTTAVDWVGYFVLYYMGYSVVFSQTISFVAAVLFAFVTNKIYVFQSKTLHPAKLLNELTSFVACRLFTGVITIAGMEIKVNGLGWPNLIGKIAVSAVSLVLNYVLSKLFIFRNKQEAR